MFADKSTVRRGERLRNTRRTAALIDFECLEPRVCLSFAVAEWYPLAGGMTWNFTGTANGSGATAVLESTAGVAIGSQTATRLRMTINSVEDSIEYRYMKHGTVGMRLLRTEVIDDAGSHTIRYANPGVLLVPPLINAGDSFAHSSTFTATSTAGPFSGTFVGNVSILGEETIVTPAGTFQALRIVRTEVTTSNGTGWTARTDIVETQWIARGIGVVRVTYTNRERNSLGDDETTTLDLRLTGSTLLGSIVGLDVTGKGLEIDKGDLTPTTADGTNYGGIDVSGQTKTRLFKLYNDSDVPLTIRGVRITGANAGEFVVVRSPVGEIAPGEQRILTIRFDPATTGFRYARVNIDSSDPSANPFTFDIRGTGVHLGRISVRAVNKSTPVTGGSTMPTIAAGTAFGSKSVTGGFVERTYLITNTGLGDLRLSGPIMLQFPMIEIPPPFAIVAQPSLTIAAGASATFKVRFDPLGVGTFYSEVVIATNDPFRPQFTFLIRGTGVM